MIKYNSYFKSPLGVLEIVADDNYILTINFVKNIKKETNNALSKKCVVQLKEYFSGKRKSFDLPIKILGSPWQTRACLEASKIPYAGVISYQDLAAMSGNIKAARAIGMALNKNKIPIIIPCYRVLGGGGQLVGYAGGLDKKEKLLEMEKSFD